MSKCPLRDNKMQRALLRFANANPTSGWSEARPRCVATITTGVRRAVQVRDCSMAPVR